jgi:hypothetical protein
LFMSLLGVCSAFAVWSDVASLMFSSTIGHLFAGRCQDGVANERDSIIQ